MKKSKILTIIGARPNFIKVGPLFNEIRKFKELNHVLVHTGQHYDYEMSEIFFEKFKIKKPDYNLGIGSGSHANQTALLMIELEKVIIKEKPDAVVVLGDVNSTLAGALTAAKLNIPICHIEAGLRSFDKKMPEEINRVLTDHISDFLFCPTANAVANLKKEGITRNVYNVGDVMYDVFLENIRHIDKNPAILKSLDIKPKEYLLLTIHRASNTKNPGDLKLIIEAVAGSGEAVVFPCHPRTKKILSKLNIAKFKNLKIIKPAGYLEMIALEKNARKIITDSGGIQKEAYWLKVPCITLRDNTEWIETVEGKWNILVGGNKEKIAKAIREFNPEKKQERSFGNGKSAGKTVKIILNNLNNG